MKTNQCPVCGMDASTSEITSKHFGVVYHLCSQQCLENFTARPSLYLGIKSPKQKGKREIKMRIFLLDSPMPETCRGSLIAELSEIMGVQEVQVSGAKVSISYDLLEATATQIEQAIEQAGAKLGGGWAERLKRGWIHYTEENALDNLAARDAACCNKPPARG